jgi:glycine dehydrogenase subunit 1
LKSFGYLPATQDDRAYMLSKLGLTSTDQLFADIPEAVRLGRALQLPESASELTLMHELNQLAGKNIPVDEATSFLGAGAYHHYIPSAVDAIISRSEFYTSYTPYQPEISQGMLQAIFEYQTLVARLYGMEAANASLYDGQTAVGEAALMAASHTRKNRIVTSTTVHPEARAVLSVYARGQSVQVDEIDHQGGILTLEALEAAMTDDTAAVLIQYPNFFGQLEDVRKIAQVVHAKGALLIVSANPITMGLLEAPGVLGADIVVGEGLSLGNSLSYGGPYVGILATTKELLRKIPGRIVGMTKDGQDRRGFVLTLQAREQHIRREKASSNICSNQALNALAASVYLGYMGKNGMREVANLCLQKAHYAARTFAQAGVKITFTNKFFHEFVIDLGDRAQAIMTTLASENIFLGYALDDAYPSLQGHVLVAVTEVIRKEQIDHVAKRLGELL